MKKTEESNLTNFIQELEKAKDQDAYKVYEKYAKSMNWDLKDQKNHQYWKVSGESASEYGEACFYETKETLSGEVKPVRPEYFNQILNQADKKELIKKFPEKCSACGFHRFFGIKVFETSLGSGITVFCPNCKKELVDISNW